MKEMLEELKELTSKEKERPWWASLSCWDQHAHRAILKVDSHQTDTQENKQSRHKQITPCQFIVSANQQADNGTSIGVGALDNSMMSHTRAPLDVKVPRALRMHVTHGETSVDKDASKTIWNFQDMEGVR